MLWLPRRQSIYQRFVTNEPGLREIEIGCCFENAYLSVLYVLCKSNSYISHTSISVAQVGVVLIPTLGGG